MENMYGKDAVQMLIQANDRMAKDISKVSEKIDKMTDMMAQLAVMSERQDNYEKHTRDSNNRVHKRIDDVVVDAGQKIITIEERLKAIDVKCESNTRELVENELLKKKVEELDGKMKEMDFGLTLSRYPKLLFLFFIVYTVWLVKDFRDIFFQFLGIM